MTRTACSQTERTFPAPGLSRALAEREIARLELGELVRRGDRLAREQLFAKGKPQLERYVRAQARGMHLEQRFVEEVSDSCLSKLHEHLPSLRDPDKFIPWLHRIARNELHRAARDQHRLAVFSDPDEYREQLERGQSYPLAFDPEFMLELHELLDEVACLPDGQRSVFVLRDLIQLDIQETAALLDISPGTVKSQRHDAIRKLRIRLSDDPS
jgi:RNA polymerase sigma-70 factor, ECF subfamily